jgi:hypothetical protein
LLKAPLPISIVENLPQLIALRAGIDVIEVVHIRIDTLQVTHEPLVELFGAAHDLARVNYKILRVGAAIALKDFISLS